MASIYVPVGYLFLPEPPTEHIPIPDLRTVANREAEHASPDLLDTIYLCQQRQAWYRDYARSIGNRTQGFVGSVRRNTPVERVAESMRRALDFDLEARREYTLADRTHQATVWEIAEAESRAQVHQHPGRFGEVSAQISAHLEKALRRLRVDRL